MNKFYKALDNFKPIVNQIMVLTNLKLDLITEFNIAI